MKKSFILTLLTGVLMFFVSCSSCSSSKQQDVKTDSVAVVDSIQIDSIEIDSLEKAIVDTIALN